MSLWCHLLPVQEGATVLLVGVSDAARQALAGTGVTPVDVGDLRASKTPPATRPFDHGLVLVAGARDAVVSEVARQIKPGGTCVLGFPNRLRNGGGLATGGRHLRAAGVRPEHALRTGPPWDNPAWAVPVGVPPIARWFVQDWYVPWSRRGVLAVVPGPLGMRRIGLLTDGMVLVGRVHADEVPSPC